jgi:hypothetical protein
MSRIKPLPFQVPQFPFGVPQFVPYFADLLGPAITEIYFFPPFQGFDPVFRSLDVIFPAWSLGLLNPFLFISNRVKYSETTLTVTPNTAAIKSQSPLIGSMIPRVAKWQQTTKKDLWLMP